MKKKRFLKIFFSILICLIILSFTFFLGFACEKNYFWKNYWVPCPKISDEYYKKEEYVTNHYGLIFSKYYYSSEADDVFVENLNPTLVGDDAEKIKNCISDFLNVLSELNAEDDVEFDYDIVTSNDYYSLVIEGKSIWRYYDESQTLLHYYDVDEHVLYVIQYSK